jgi:hypothetical protein
MVCKKSKFRKERNDYEMQTSHSDTDSSQRGSALAIGEWSADGNSE